jgi:acetate kinase
MNGVDCIVFTAGLGENSPETREAVCDGLTFLGINIDKTKNAVRGKKVDISNEGSKVKVLIVPTDEELMIASDTLNLIK